VVLHITNLQPLETLWHKEISMGHFAKVCDGIVTKVIVAEPEFMNTFVDDTPGEWIQTSYNTRGGIHALGGTPLRMNYAGIGYTYDSVRDAFISPKPFESWILDENSCLWNPPVPKPTDDKMYFWDEDSVNWVEREET
jgi:hypothetical protein